MRLLSESVTCETHGINRSCMYAVRPLRRRTRPTKRLVRRRSYEMKGE